MSSLHMIFIISPIIKRFITIFIWAFALAALYKATKSVIACAIYHSFMDAIGAVYDWNLLFDAFDICFDICNSRR